jgi:hypothetical protein
MSKAFQLILQRSETLHILMDKVTFHIPVISIFLFIFDSRLTELTSETDWLDTNTIMLSISKASRHHRFNIHSPFYKWVMNTELCEGMT